MRTLRMAMVAGLTLAASTVAGAQMRRTAVIPAGYQPPAGLCRVWYGGVAPSRQPAPTDCNTARSRVTANSFLVYGGQGSQRTNNGRNSQGGWSVADGRAGRRDARRDDRYSDNQQREDHEGQKAWKKSHRHDRGHDDGDDGDDGDDRRGQVSRDGQRYPDNGGNPQGGWFPNGTPNQQGRVRVP